MKFFSRTLSSAGSISSPTSSINKGWPKDKASSRCWRKYLWLRLVTFRLFSFSRLVIQILPWPCGSISRGNLVALVTIIPFCVDNSSDGSPYKIINDIQFLDQESCKNCGKIKPCKFHSPMVGSSTSILIIFRSSVNGIS